MPRDLHYDSMRNPSLLSFQSSTASTSTVPTNVTTTSSSTILGIGSLTGRALVTLGEATIRRGSAIVIQARLRTLKSQLPHDDSYISPKLSVAYRDVLELSRRGCYNPQIRKKALRIMLLQIYTGNTRHLLQYLSEWPPIEIALFLREVMLSMPSELTSLEEFQEPMHIELMQELNSASQIEVMWAVQFFAQVIVKVEGGPQAFIEAQSPDVILALDLATSLNFFHVHTRDGPQPYIWDDARNVLSQYPETARHRLLVILELRRNSPSHFLASQRFLENVKYSKKRHDMIEEELRITKAKIESQVKVLLLGSHESGREAVLKQLCTLYSGGFTRRETGGYRMRIFNNLLHGVRDILNSLSDFSTGLSPENIPNANVLAHAQDAVSDIVFPVVLCGPLRHLWEDPAFEAWRRRKTDPLNLSYYFQHLDRLFSPGYLPSAQDILHYRSTTMLTETVFKTRDSEILLVGIGGHPLTWRKFMPLFEDVTCVVFVVDLDAYDQVEYAGENQMEHAMNMWDSISNSWWFRGKSFILLLNNHDVFEEKIVYSDIRNHFPDYTGSTGDVHQGCEYFTKRLSGLANGLGLGGSQLYVHYVAGNDTSMLRVVLGYIQGHFYLNVTSDINLILRLSDSISDVILNEAIRSITLI